MRFHFLYFLIGLAVAAPLVAAGPPSAPDLSSVPKDLAAPMVEDGVPSAGKRVRQTTPDWEGTEVHHVLYLPRNWQPGKVYPLLAEYAGNGGFKNAFGDVSEGVVEGSHLGYGLSGGQDYIWVCLPFVQVQGDHKSNAAQWWGKPDETVAYCVATMHFLEKNYGADPKALVLCGFSRGAIACNYIGLRNDEIAGLWRAFLCHSHYDGVRTQWPYSDADRASARVRLDRLKGRPQFISHEVSVEPTRAYLKSTGVTGAFTLVDLPFRNHSDEWVLRDCETRRQARAWLKSIGLPAPE